MSAIFEAELAEAEAVIISEAMGPSMAEAEDVSEPITIKVCKWSTLEGKIEALQHLGLAKEMSPEQKRWFVKNHELFKFTPGSGKSVFVVSGARYRSLVFQAIFKKAKLWERPRVSSVAYTVTDTELTVTVYHK
jgi:hypothetical protein